ncbi:cytoplasmic RNA-binding protein, partial [Irineochytrium annulatum]
MSDIIAHDEDSTADDVDQELVAMKARVQQMEEEAAKLRAMQEQVEKDMNSSSSANGGMTAQFGPAATDASLQEKQETDARSVHVGNVDYSSTPEEIQSHFQACGVINRVTILCDKWTGFPKGFAYVEFADPAMVGNALSLNDSLFKGRLIKVTPKRTNIPTFMRGGYRGGGGRGGGRGGYR